LTVTTLDVDGTRFSQNRLLHIPKQIGLIVPDRSYTSLKYWVANAFNLSAGAGAVANVRFRPTAAYDIDPTLGGTSMPGFVELAALYGSYRVTCSSIKVTGSNASATPFQLIVCPSNADLGAAMLAANVSALQGQPFSKHRVVGAVGSPPAVINSSMTTEKIYGDKAVYSDHNFSAVANGVPANNWFWNIAAYTPLGGSAINVIIIEITVGIEWYDRFFLPA